MEEKLDSEFSEESQEQVNVVSESNSHAKSAKMHPIDVLAKAVEFEGIRQILSLMDLKELQRLAEDANIEAEPSNKKGILVVLAQTWIDTGTKKFLKNHVSDSEIASICLKLDIPQPSHRSLAIEAIVKKITLVGFETFSKNVPKENVKQVLEETSKSIRSAGTAESITPNGSNLKVSGKIPKSLALSALKEPKAEKVEKLNSPRTTEKVEKLNSPRTDKDKGKTSQKTPTQKEKLLQVDKHDKTQKTQPSKSPEKGRKIKNLEKSLNKQKKQKSSLSNSSHDLPPFEEVLKTGDKDLPKPRKSTSTKQNTSNSPPSPINKEITDSKTPKSKDKFSLPLKISKDQISNKLKDQRVSPRERIPKDQTVTPRERISKDQNSTTKDQTISPKDKEKSKKQKNL